MVRQHQEGSSPVTIFAKKLHRRILIGFSGMRVIRVSPDLRVFYFEYKWKKKISVLSNSVFVNVV